jgi:pectate lyase
MRGPLQYQLTREDQMEKMIWILTLIFLMNTNGCKETPTQMELKSHTPAFPGAEGFGAYTMGGRGGNVYIVTNLNDDGAGSLRNAVEASGPRIVVFEISGTIELESRLRISNPYITIAGQTAPGDGICLKNYELDINTHDVIIRYLRVRPGDPSQAENDAISIRSSNVIVDHCSASWSIDEALSSTGV